MTRKSWNTPIHTTLSFKFSTYQRWRILIWPKGFRNRPMTYRNPSFRVWSDINKFMTAVPRLGSKGSRYIHLPIYRKKKKALSQNSVKLRVLNNFCEEFKNYTPREALCAVNIISKNSRYLSVSISAKNPETMRNQISTKCLQDQSWESQLSRALHNNQFLSPPIVINR